MAFLGADSAALECAKPSSTSGYFPYFYLSSLHNDESEESAAEWVAFFPVCFTSTD